MIKHGIVLAVHKERDLRWKLSTRSFLKRVEWLCPGFLSDLAVDVLGEGVPNRPVFESGEWIESGEGLQVEERYRLACVENEFMQLLARKDVLLVLFQKTMDKQSVRDVEREFERLDERLSVQSRLLKTFLAVNRGESEKVVDDLVQLARDTRLIDQLSTRTGDTLTCLQYTTAYLCLLIAPTLKNNKWSDKVEQLKTVIQGKKISGTRVDYLVGGVCCRGRIGRCFVEAAGVEGVCRFVKSL